MEKLLVEKGVFDALEKLSKDKYFLFEDGNLNMNRILDTHLYGEWNGELTVIEELNAGDLSIALLIGYELIKSPEDIIKDKIKDVLRDYERFEEKGKKFSVGHCIGFKDGINFVLETYNIKLDEVN